MSGGLAVVAALVVGGCSSSPSKLVRFCDASHDARELGSQFSAVMAGATPEPTVLRQAIEAAVSAARAAADIAPAAVAADAATVASADKKVATIFDRLGYDLAAVASDATFQKLAAPDSELTQARDRLDTYLADACGITAPTTAPADTEPTVAATTSPPSTVAPVAETPLPPTVPAETAAPATAAPETTAPPAPTAPALSPEQSLNIDLIVAAVVAQLSAPATPEQSACIRDGFLVTFGYDRLIEISQTGQSTAEEDIAAANTVTGCGLDGTPILNG